MMENRSRRLSVVARVGLVLAAVSGGRAWADVSPAGCNANLVTLSISRDKLQIVNGETVTYTVGVFNPGPGGPTDKPCDASSVTVKFTCPAADGTASGTTTVLGMGLSLPANHSGDTVFPPVSCVVNLTPGVMSATAQAQAGQLGDLTQGRLHDSVNDDSFSRVSPLTITVLTCTAQVDKEVSCDGGVTFHDVGFTTNDADDTTDFCASWNAHGTTPAENITVRYVVSNTGEADLHNCTVKESNGAITGSAVTIGDVPGSNSTGTSPNNSTPVDITNACSATLASGEPDQADLTCDCTTTPGEITRTAFDRAKFLCLTPGLTVMKQCQPMVQGGTNNFTITLHNSGSADLANCTVQDTFFPGDPTCTNSPTPAPGFPHTVATLAAGGADVQVTGTLTNLPGGQSCNQTVVTCDIVGSVGPKHLTAMDHTECSVTSCVAQIDKEMFNNLSQGLTPQKRAQLALFFARGRAMMMMGMGHGGKFGQGGPGGKRGFGDKQFGGEE